MLAPNRDALSPILIDTTTLDEAFARLIIQVVDNPGFRVSPLTLSIGANNVDEMTNGNNGLRQALDAAIDNTDGAHSIDTVAFTIFPKRFYEISDSVDDFFDLYKRSFPRIQARNRANSRGLYFERLTMYGDEVPCDGNQLKWFIERYLSRRGVRESMYQAAIFDPTRDHSNTARLGFPCLHSLSFVPRGDSLILNAFYPTQQIYRKAYGNYLGLINLGGFMAEQMGLVFRRLNVMVGVAKLDTSKSGELAPVVTASRALIDQCDGL